MRGHGHHSKSMLIILLVVTYTDAGWTTRPGGTSQSGQLVFIANSELLQGRESTCLSLDILAFESIETGGKIFLSAAETQAAADAR